MDETQQKIISLFKRKGNEIDTGEILLEAYPESKSLFGKEDTDSKRKKARLHRKLLYHINELVKSGILRFSKFGEKGLKYFELNMMDGEEITEINPKYKRKITISKPRMPSLPIESYEQRGIVLRYNAGSWIDQLNSVIINSRKISGLEDFRKIFENAVSIVNDCICFDNFDSFLHKLNEKEITEIIERINSESRDFGRKTSCIINLKGISREKIIHAASIVTEPDTENIVFIYNIESEEVQEQFGLFTEMIEIYNKKRRTLYIKNGKLQKAPAFLGGAGPYAISDKEWDERGLADYVSIACSQSSLIVDVEKFYSLYGLDTLKFSELMINISKSFLSANSIQRRKSQEYFKSLISLDRKNEHEFLEFSRNYIRFWNFGLSQPGLDSRLVINMISEAKKRIEEFARAEETIYKSCGMPTRFRIALSCAFKESNEKLSSAKYKKLELMGLDELYKAKTKKEIVERETVTEMFNGGNDVTFHRIGFFNADDAAREISVIMNTYKLPMFSYNFGGLKGDMKITSYF